MDEQQGAQKDAGVLPEGMDSSALDITEPHIGLVSSDEFEERARMEVHTRTDTHDRMHVDLTRAEYTPQEVARMLGTSLDVVMHAIWTHELKAETKGQDVICIDHSDVVDWLRRRGPGI